LGPVAATARVSATARVMAMAWVKVTAQVKVTVRALALALVPPVASHLPLTLMLRSSS
jgi:hypothetical protein